MVDLYIFIAGSAVTIVIGTAVALMITANNRAIERGDQTTGGGSFSESVGGQ